MTHISSLAKFFQLITIGEQYIQDAMRGMTANQVGIFRNYHNRIKWIKTDIYSRMNNPDLLRTELDVKDMGTIDSCLNIMLGMDEIQRQQAELCLQAIAKGELFLTEK